MYATLPSVRSRPGRPGGWRGSGWLHPLRVTALSLCCAAVLAAGMMAGMGDTRAGTYEDLTVQPGDTLWGIAARHYPDSDVRGRVDEIMRVNDLSQPVIQPGEHLRIPAG